MKWTRPRLHKPSADAFVCLKDYVRLVGELEAEKDMLHKHSQLETPIRKMVEESLGEGVDETTSFVGTGDPQKRCRLYEYRIKDGNYPSGASYRPSAGDRR
ncbi:hypothetical protein WMW72_14100 [Paenibacillus filicis]|uniref:Uncharacterized protein n=1 Tax=Paenibacillus filicis TaxID=669464 RepID=A0ABU9DJK3_9BACL